MNRRSYEDELEELFACGEEDADGWVHLDVAPSSSSRPFLQELELRVSYMLDDLAPGDVSVSALTWTDDVCAAVAMEVVAECQLRDGFTAKQALAATIEAAKEYREYRLHPELINA